ncbi:MAG: putative helicase HelY [Candidatus Moanabacter tarae]|uniref:Putative helicase HelY n=1 Tax=Candidatus Moanibacter tarae TaxID=2200854 RepID=A0A2Z4ACA6_9BACT|nr:MAG: putative helicase HelY [Candidatus Moanabacter tarae]|tara:strand:+ start:8087 stop:10552 length:2466 start_codon:yes stop_codon:yes gene_type:complete
MDNFETSLKLPDLWQQDAIRHLRAGRDVVVDAPTGSGKTYILELFLEGGYRQDTIFTVPTRALANDKLLEWSSRNWEVGITTGDLTENIDAPLVVATLETQKRRFLDGAGPGLLVVDEFQMIGDPARGVNYELIIAMAPQTTQLLLLSGTVANPGHVVDWLKKLGRDPVLVSTSNRPVPLEEVYVEALPNRVPKHIKGYWPRLVAKTLMADMGPVLIFAPRRKASESIAREISAALPIDLPLELTAEQKRLAGPILSKLLRNRISFHHSGLTYRQRAGLVEPLAKNGQLRVVVATTGLAAGINFSLRSVFVTDREYRVGDRYFDIRPDELLQMFGRAGRRGLDSKGFILADPGKPRLKEGRQLLLKRTNQIEWPALLFVMHSAIEKKEKPDKAAADLTSRLFSSLDIPLGFDAFLKDAKNRCPVAPEPESRHVRQSVIEILNTQGKWERRKPTVRDSLGKALIFYKRTWIPALQHPSTVAGVRIGTICKLRGKNTIQYGREVSLSFIADDLTSGELILTKWLYRALRERKNELRIKNSIKRHNWTLKRLEQIIIPLLPTLTHGGSLDELVERNGFINARLDYSKAEAYLYVDSEGKFLLNPPEHKKNEEFDFSFREAYTESHSLESPVSSWFQLGLIDNKAVPTRRGEIFSFFNRAEGFAIATALEDPNYDIPEIIQHIVNLRAGHRFTDFESYSSRLGNTCRIASNGATYPGYLDKGKPIDYGDGAAEILTMHDQDPSGLAQVWKTEMLSGDIERVRLEWISLLNQITHSPNLKWDRWMQFKKEAQRILSKSTAKPPISNLPPLPLSQKQRYRCDHVLGR